MSALWPALGMEPPWKRKILVVFVLPHMCVEPQSVDRNCDLNIDKFSAVYEAAVRKAGFKTLILTGDVPRRKCDLNRALKCAFESNLWRNLQRATADYAPEDVRVVEVHAFRTPEDYGVGENDMSVVLLLHSGANRFEQRVAIQTDSAQIAGSTVNAIGQLAASQNWPHVLIETRQDTSLATQRKIGRGIADAILE